MTRMLLMLTLVVCTGCKVTAGVYLEKDWQTDHSFANPDLRSKFKLEAQRDFKSWDEAFTFRQGEPPCK